MQQSKYVADLPAKRALAVRGSCLKLFGQRTCRTQEAFAESNRRRFLCHRRSFPDQRLLGRAQTRINFGCQVIECKCGDALLPETLLEGRELFAIFNKSE